MPMERLLAVGADLVAICRKESVPALDAFAALSDVALRACDGSDIMLDACWTGGAILCIFHSVQNHQAAPRGAQTANQESSHQSRNALCSALLKH